ncbi:MAG: ATP-binding protein [Candidatus Yanofskybacteria bacterium]|nr:ATP-binding protein [Candidatus Yanofskybacteria bacterium]
MRFKTLKGNKLFVVFRNLIIVEALFYLTFLVLALAADWGDIYEGLAVSGYVRFEVVEFLLLILSQLGLITLVFIKSLNEEKSIEEIIKSGEHEKLEFKTSLRWDVKRDTVNRELEKAVMKTVAAFLNSDGGHLLIGVDDGGQPVGLENDIATLVKQDADGFENHFNNIFNSMIGPEFRRFVKLRFDNIGGKTVCSVNIEPGRKPAYLKTGDGENFYIRTGNVSTPLKMSEVATYISSWWSK